MQDSDLSLRAYLMAQELVRTNDPALEVLSYLGHARTRKLSDTSIEIRFSHEKREFAEQLRAKRHLLYRFALQYGQDVHFQIEVDDEPKDSGKNPTKTV